MKTRYIAQSEWTVCVEKLKTTTDKTKQYRHFTLDGAKFIQFFLSLNKIYKKVRMFSLELCSMPLVGFCAYWVRTEIREIMWRCFVTIFSHISQITTGVMWRPSIRNITHFGYTICRNLYTWLSLGSCDESHVVRTTFCGQLLYPVRRKYDQRRVVDNEPQTDRRTDVVSTKGVLPLFIN